LPRGVCGRRIGWGAPGLGRPSVGRSASSRLGAGGGSMKGTWGASLLSWCDARGKEEGIDPRRELRPAAPFTQASSAVPSTQASPAVRRESSYPSIGAGMQIRVASLY
uniref:Uncharacterized protein n=2 Tax=Aegilops tauschii subsp. strangulata TaxID=200361 RepID=A0A453N2V0_AEGTS